MYLARHGESEANVSKIFVNSGEGYGLTERGRAQARALADELQSEGIGIVFASPLARAQETAQIVCERLGLSFETRSALTEFSVGSLEGCSVSNSWSEFSRVETEWMANGHSEARLAGGECLDDIRSRFLSLVDELTQRYGDTSERILLIAHGGVLACALPAILANADNHFALAHPIRPAGLIVAKKVGSEFYCLRWTDTEFSLLSEAVPS